MSNGTFAELPPENMPDNINLPDEPSVMLLLPHNKYLLGTADRNNGKWIYASVKPGLASKDVFLYDNEVLSLLNDGASPTVIPAGTVNALKRELFSLTEPPGRYEPTVLMLRTLIPKHEIFSGIYNKIPDEKKFNRAMKNDLFLRKLYWTLRFALSRNELETVRRLAAWIKADPKTFENPKYKMKIWFSLLEVPDKKIMDDLEKLSFSKLEIQRMSEQHLSPLVLYNPISGRLVLARFGKVNTMFLTWIYLNHELYYELAENKKMSMTDIIHAVWGEYETQQTMEERSKYRGADD